MGIHTDRRFPFAAPAGEVWTALTDVERYATWWPWLVEFDGADFEPSAHWRCTVRSPLRYAVRFQIELVSVEWNAGATATLAGDIEGTAAIEVASVGPGSTLRLVSDLSSNVGAVAAVDRFAPRLAAASHHWVIDRGLGQFRDHNRLGPPAE